MDQVHRKNDAGLKFPRPEPVSFWKLARASGPACPEKHAGAGLEVPHADGLTDTWVNYP
jgi:hypothetical protein